LGAIAGLDWGDEGSRVWGMKKLLAAMFAAMLMVGCGEDDGSVADNSELNQIPTETFDLDDSAILEKIIAEALAPDRFHQRGIQGEELPYLPNDQTPYTGWMKEMYVNGQVKALFRYKDGKEEGLWTLWFENGRKKMEENWKNGKKDGRMTLWFENGRKQFEANFKGGKKEGLETGWYENGHKKFEGNYKHGKMNGLEKGWYENGKKSSEANFKDGNLDGLLISYKDDGAEKFRVTYKDGEIVRD
jgi:hypothetical protein